MADEAGTSDTNISELVNERQDLTAEMADKFASVPELKTTREELLDIFGGKTDAHLNQRRKRKRDAALASFDRLPDPAQDLALDMLTMLEKRERDRTKGDK